MEQSRGAGQFRVLAEHFPSGFSTSGATSTESRAAGTIVLQEHDGESPSCHFIFAVNEFDLERACRCPPVLLLTGRARRHLRLLEDCRRSRPPVVFLQGLVALEALVSDGHPRDRRAGTDVVQEDERVAVRRFPGLGVLEVGVTSQTWMTAPGSRSPRQTPCVSTSLASTHSHGAGGAAALYSTGTKRRSASIVCMRAARQQALPRRTRPHATAPAAPRGCIWCGALGLGSD